MQERKECNIVQDLLLNYVDGVLTEDSKNFVEEHFKRCNACQEKLNDIKKELEENQKSEEEKEIDYLKNVKKKMNKKNKFIVVIGVILAITIIINVIIYINYITTDNEMEIFLNDDITAEELKNIEETITKQDNTAKITYISKEEALQKMKAKFENGEKLLSGYTENNIFPASYNIKANKESIKNIEDIIISMSGVKKVHSYSYNPYEMFAIKIISLFK